MPGFGAATPGECLSSKAVLVDVLRLSLYLYSAIRSPFESLLSAYRLYDPTGIGGVASPDKRDTVAEKLWRRVVTVAVVGQSGPPVSSGPSSFVSSNLPCLPRRNREILPFVATRFFGRANGSIVHLHASFTRHAAT